ncbi:hypothetical protein L1987_33055 [Smallanthus sonchifolius]|uniref:Uncharacterized protein n=1 Tax=Smallanthus sonchifolius TaxID=185202 RepID=A0ACB9HQA9_9ASTR|nr:hypothetical protein L1987_33055 [Smallanthus sonchifolius]
MQIDMASMFQTIDADVRTTMKPPKLQSASEYCNWKQRIENLFLVLDFNPWRSDCEGPNDPMVPAVEAGGVPIPKDPSSEELTAQFNKYIRLVCELKSAEVELANADVVKQFMTSLPQKWLTTTTNGEEGYDWTYSEEIKQNQALVADVKGKESSEKVSSVKVDNDEIALYKHHNQILVDELNNSLAINTDLKEAEKVLNEKSEALPNDLAVGPEFLGSITCKCVASLTWCGIPRD